MISSKVYFSDLRASPKRNLLSKIIDLMDRAGTQDMVSPRNLVAIKLHFGERGNTAFIRPVYIRSIVDRLKELGASPFLTDTNTLYAGSRADSVSHLNTAIENGFAYSVVNAPIIIADGVRGGSYSSVEVNQEYVTSAYLARDIVEADVLVSLAHFKGHELSGFGGTIKNLGMGCAARPGKLAQHSDLSPKVKRKKCTGCGDCFEHCAQGAISLTEDKAAVDPEKCIGCGECISICPKGAIQVRWNADAVVFQKKMAEYAYSVLRTKGDRALFMNFLMDISPACDCCGHCDAPIVKDIGVLASRDPLGIDQASVDLVNRQMATEGSCLTECRESGADKFKALYPKIDWSVQLAHGEKIGLGTRKYELIPV